MFPHWGAGGNSMLSSSSAGSVWDGRPFPSPGPVCSWILFLLSKVSRQYWILCSCIALYWSSALITLSNSMALKVHRTVLQFSTYRTAERDRQLQRHPDSSVPAAGNKEHPRAPQLSSVPACGELSQVPSSMCTPTWGHLCSGKQLTGNWISLFLWNVAVFFTTFLDDFIRTEKKSVKTWFN